MSKKIFIADCQVFQEPAWHRGMGKYSLSLLRELQNSDDFKSQYELKLLFNSNLPFEKSVAESVESEIGPIEHIFLALPVYSQGNSLTKVQKKCIKTVNDYFDSNYKDSDITFIIMSLFLQYACPVYPTNAKKVLLYYDLIMLQYYRMYLGLGASEQHFAHYKTLFESDLILSISKTVANDLTIYLGISKENIANIDGAPIRREKVKSTMPNIAVNKNYILMPSGGDPRKNNHRAVKGFEIFNKKHDNKYKLILTSMFGEGMRNDLYNISSNIIFTGNVEESELSWLYENCEAVLFAPEYEGLGLPILEAADFKKPVACSDISVFREMSEKAFYFFDHMSPESIALALEDAINNVNFLDKSQLYGDILTEYSWKNTVQKTLKSLGSLKSKNVKGKDKLAILTPNIQIDNFIGYYMALQYPALEKKYSVDFYYDFASSRPNVVRPNHLAFVANIKTATELTDNYYKDIVSYVNDDDDSCITAAKSLVVPTELHLYSNNLQTLYESMRSKNIISDDRFKIEESINVNLGYDTAFTGTLINKAKHIFTLDEKDSKTFKRVAKILGAQVKITKDSVELPSLPFKISKSQTMSKPLLYVSSSADVDILNKIAQTSLHHILVDVVFSSSCDRSIIDECLERLDVAESITNPTDFELVSMIQRSKYLIVATKKETFECYFLKSRAKQLSRETKIISMENNDSREDNYN